LYEQLEREQRFVGVSFYLCVKGGAMGYSTHIIVCCVFNLTKDSNLLLQAIHSLSTGGFFKKTPRLYSGLKKTYKNLQNKKTQAIPEKHCVDRKK
jgi:hypothetical protein